MGTHNCLMRLGDGLFLEIIAPDPAATPQRTRWFSLDDPLMRARLEQAPQLISWVIRVVDLGGALRLVDRAVGEAVPLTRGSLAWLISVPRDGSMPFDGAFPTLIEWPAGRIPLRVWLIWVASLSIGRSSIPRASNSRRRLTGFSSTRASPSQMAQRSA